MSETTQADQIIDALKEQANKILAAALGSTPLSAFNVGAKGNMPYYWQDPSTLKFNQTTYNWIDSNLKAGADPKQFDGLFTNEYIQALSKVSYSLSSADQTKLNQAHQNTTEQQTAVLNAWQSAFGSLPSGEGMPIDQIATIIATQWAQPATTLTALANSPNLNAALNNTPASGKPVIPVFANWLNAINSVISLENAVTMNQHYLGQALAGVQTPTAANGATETNAGNTVPTFTVATQLADIVNGLKDASNAINLDMDVERATSSEFQVSISGGTRFSIPVLDLLSVNVGGQASYFSSNIATTDNKTSVSMTFPGVTLVNYGPADYNASTGLNWFWMSPIRDAISNGNKDVSGFKFSPDPQIDFSDNGPFGYTMGAAISNYPTITIKVTSSQYQEIQQTFEQSASVGISFLGIPLGIGGKESTYSSKTQVDASSQTVTITLSPPPELVAGNTVDSVGWVLGVQAEYPAVVGETVAAEPMPEMA